MMSESPANMPTNAGNANGLPATIKPAAAVKAFPRIIPGLVSETYVLKVAMA